MRHMHPYCMAICVENDDGEQMLPEGGILLEVVDQGENGEPILAIPDMDLPVSLSLDEQKLAEEDEVASDSSEHIFIDVEDVTGSEAPVKFATSATPDLCSVVKDEMIVERQKEEVKEKSPSRRKKKKKCKEQCQTEPVEGRVLRSGTVRQMPREEPRKPEKRSVKEKKHKVPKVCPASTPVSSSVKPKKQNLCQTVTQTEITTTTRLPEMKVHISTCASPRQETALLKDNSEMSRPTSHPQQ